MQNDMQGRVVRMRAAHDKAQQAMLKEYDEQSAVLNKRIAELLARSMRMDAAHLKYEQDTAKSLSAFEANMQGLLAQVLQNNADRLTIQKAKSESQQKTCIAELDCMHKKYVQEITEASDQKLAEITRAFDQKLTEQVERANLAVYMEAKARAKLNRMNPTTTKIADMWADGADVDADAGGPSLDSIKSFIAGEDMAIDNIGPFNAGFSGGTDEPMPDGGLGFFGDENTPPMEGSLPECPFAIQAGMYPNSTQTVGDRMGENEEASAEPPAFKSAKHLADQQAGGQARMQLQVPVNAGSMSAPRELRYLYLCLTDPV